MSICQTTHSGLLVGISVIWRLRRASGGRNEAHGTLSWEMSVFPSLSLPCYPSRRRLCLRTPPMTLVPPYPSLPPLPFDPRCHPNSPNIFGELMYLQPGSNPCSSSHDWSLQTPLYGLPVSIHSWNGSRNSAHTQEIQQLLYQTGTASAPGGVHAQSVQPVERPTGLK